MKRVTSFLILMLFLWAGSSWGQNIFFEGFETGNTQAVAPVGWTQVSVAGTATWLANTSLTTYNRTPRTGSWNAYLAYSNTDWLFKQVTLTGGTTYKLTFYARQDVTSGTNVLASYGTTNDVAGMTNPIITSTAVINGAYQFFSGTFSPASSGTYYIGIRADLTSSPWYISIDDISLDVFVAGQPDPPSNPNPATSAIGVPFNGSLTWNFGTNTVTYDLFFGPTGNMTQVVSGGTAGATGSYIYSGLNPQSVYQWQVIEKNGALVTNGPIWSFTTACSTISTYPFTEDFGATLGCWTASEGVAGATYHWATTTADATHGVAGPKSGTHFAFLNIYNANTTYNPYYLVSQPFTLDATTKQVKYYYWLGTGGYQTTPVPLTLQISTNGGSTWTDLFAHTAANSTFSSTSALTGWTLNTVIIDSYTNQTVIFRFASNSNYGSGYCNQGIDEFIIEDAPACLAPTALTATDITATSASLGWTSPASLFDIEYGLAGFTPTGEPSAGLSGVTNPKTLDGLSANTSYGFYVRSNCSGTYSDWVGPKTFTTACEAQTTPYAESFDVVVAPQLPSCTQVTDNNSDGIAWVTSTSTPRSTPNDLRIGYNSSLAMDDWFFSPALNLNSGTYKVSFWYRSSGSYPEKMEVKWGTAANAAGMTNGPIFDNDNILNAVFEEGVGFMTVTQTGNYYVGWHGYSDADMFYILVDDISIYETFYGELEGHVYVSGSTTPIEGATIECGTLTTTTNVDGYFNFPEVEMGTYDVTASAPDFISSTVSGVAIVTNNTTVQDFALTFSKIQVSPLLFTQSLEPEQTATQVLTISNVGGTGPLDWTGSVLPLEDKTQKVVIPAITNPVINRSKEVSMLPAPKIEYVPSNSAFDVLRGTTATGLKAFPTPIEIVTFNTDVPGTYVSTIACPTPVGTSNFWVGADFDNAGNYYGVDYVNKQFCLIDPVTGTYTLIGATGLTVSITDLAFDKTTNVMYASIYNSVGSDLYTIDIATGTPHFVGNIIASGLMISMACDGEGQLYGLNSTTDFIYTIDKVTGTGTSLGSAGIAANYAQSMAWDPESDIVYLASYTTLGELRVLDRTTGATSLVGSFPSGAEMEGLAFAAPLASWISIEPKSGTIAPGESQMVDVIFDATGLLDPSTHLATITINNNALPDAKGSIEIPATLNVAWLTAPAVATNPYPANAATLVPTQPVFTWTNGARTDSVRIKITKPPFTTVYQSPYFAGESWDAASIDLKLLKQTTYNWQITSKNSAGITAGTVWTFSTKGEGTLQGTVTDAYNNQPLEGVVITADELRSLSDTTDANGFYQFLKVPEGNYSVKAELENYITQTAPVVVLPNLTTTQNFALSLYLTPPAGLQAHVVDYFDVHLTWIGPGGFTPTWLTYSQDAISNSIGVDGPANFDVAARFLPADLALLEGGSVTKVQFWPGEAGAVCTYTIKVWEGVSPPTLIYSEVIPTASIVTDVWNEVTLATPVAIDATKELWVGYNVNTTAGFPAGCDPGPQDEGLGNMIYWSGAWTTLTGLNAALTYNWAIKAYIDAAKGASMTQPVVNNTSKIVNTGTLTSRPVLVDPPTVSITENGGTRPLTSYNIYRDGSLIGNSTGLSYDDLGLAAGDYEYTVKGVYPQGESAATLPAYVSIMPPPTLITAEQAGLEIFLEWESNQEKAARALTAIDGNTGNMANGKQMNSKANKAELLHGPTMVVENGSGRAVGDDCSNPIVIGALPYTDANTTCGRGNTYSETCLGSYDGGEDIIYQLVLTETKTIKFTMTTTDTWTGMLVTDACPPGATCIATATNTSAGGVTITQELAAGTYYIMMDTWPAPACIAAFDFTVEDYTPQPGEACELAIPAVVGLNTAPQAPYWFEFTPTENKAITISSCLDGQVVDTDLEVYDACGGLLVAANDDLLEGCLSYEYSSAVTFNAVAGVTYKISWIDTWEITGFDFTIELNDPCLVECPVGALAEGELCGEDLNSGCNVAVPVYTPISIGDVYCGSAWANGGSRDTDWYELTIDTPKTLTWTVTGEFPVLAFIIDGNADCAGLTILSQATAMACETAVATATVAPGKYWLWVGNQLFVGNPCGNYNNYVAELTAVDAFLPYYNVFRDGVDIANVYSTTYYDGDVVMGSEYCYTVSEVIAPTAGGETLQSNELCVPVVCPVPTNLAVSTVTTNSAILTWTAGSNELTWNLSYGPVGFDPLTGGTLLPDLAATTYELNGLDPFTGYDVYVQANCSETYISEWVGPVSFLTSCEYACDYTFILLDTYGDGWNGGLMQVRQNGLVVATLGAGFTTGATFTEYVSICDGFDFDVFWSTAGSYASEMGLQIVDPAGNTLYNVSPIGAALVGTIIYAGTGECPACPVPTSPTATNITMNSADLEWTSTGTLWNIEYGEFGFVQGEGTLISGVTNPYTLGGLDASTAYTFYVQNDCGDVQSDWVSYTFTTACPLSGLPFAEDFEGVVFPPACWNVYDFDGLGTFWSSSTTYANSPTHSAKHGYSTAATDGQDGWMVTPGLDLTTATAPQLSFWEYVAFPTYYVYRAVYISTGSADPADGDFVEFYEMGAGASAWTEWNFDLSAYAGQVVHIAFVYQGYDADDWYIDDVAVNEYVAPSQVIPMPLGWNGWSSYIDPLTDATFADVVAPVAADMTISQYFSQLYWPAYGINTMGNFSNAHGYLTKMAADKSLTLSGDYASTTVAVNAGWNIFPVNSTCNVDVAELLSIDGFVIAVEIAGNGVYYPAYNINTLLELVPGKAYYVKTTAAGSFTFPACAADKGYSYNKPVRSENITNWNDVTYTGVSHTVIFSENTASLLENGDVIGAFTNGGLCAGMTIVNSTTTAMSLFADDISTGDVDGFAEGEMLNFRVMRPSTNEEFILDVTYNVQSPNFDGLFAVSGLSVIDNFTMSITGINNPSLSGLSIYPNPSTGIFNISVNGMDNNIDYVIMNAQGQQVVEGKLLNSQEIDLTSQPKGVYFIKFTGNNILRIEKVVVK